MQVYLDNAATTRVDDNVVKAMLPYYTEKYGNASSPHSLGQEAKQALEESRAAIANAIGASSDEIVFTSGGTESNNLAIKGIAFSAKKEKRGNHIITTKIEHDCVLNSCKWLETQGFRITYLDVDSEGFVDLKKLESAITKNTILISVIHGNNEIGTVQDLKAIGEICRKHKVLFHTDACQSFTKTELNAKKMNIDLVTLNAHKIHGPKGVGALYIRKGTPITPLEHGGGHEFKLRSGTENIPGIVGFAASVKVSKKANIAALCKLRNYMIDRILKEIPDTIINGPANDKDGKKRLYNNVNFCFKYVESESIGAYLDSYGISSSAGSACSSHSLEPSHVLMAIGRDAVLANGSLRLTLSKYTTKQEIDYAVEKLKKTIGTLRKMSPLFSITKK